MFSASTAEQKKHGLSVDSQISALKDFCAAGGYFIAGVYSDAGISARKRYTRRPALLQLLTDCRDKKIDVILFTKLDRWFRSVGDYYEVQRQLDAAGVPWRAIWEDYETETSAGVFKVNIMLSVAQSEADRTSERIRDVMQYKRARGDYVGKAPLGYVKQGGALLKNPETAPAVEALFSTFLRTLNTAEAIRAAAALGLHTNRETINKLFLNPAYAGTAAGGYTCPAYITPEQFDFIRDVRHRRTRTAKHTRAVYIFSGLCRCGICGRPMAGKTRHRQHVDGSPHVAAYYECSAYSGSVRYHRAFSINGDKIEAQLLDTVDDALKSVRIAVKARNASADKDTAEKQKAALRLKLKRVQAVYMDGGLSDAEYTARRDAISAELAAIRTEPEKVPEPLPDNWRETYDGLDPEHRRRFWQTVLRAITVNADRSISLTFC